MLNSAAMSDETFRKPCEPWVTPGGIECHTADMTVAVAADVKLKSVQSRLAEFDQWIPIDGNPDDPIGTLGERNSSGPLRLGYGAWRDLLLGCQFRIATGERITAGGRTMKNVAGYDLTKFMVGQRGIFGRVETIVTRTYLRPVGAIAARFEPSDKWIGKVIATPLRPRWAVMTSQALWCGWLDDAITLNFYEGLIAAAGPLEFFRRSLEEDIEHRAKLWSHGEEYFRASVPPARIEQFVKLAEVTEWSADAAFGIVIGPLVTTDTDRITLAARTTGGNCTLFRGDSQPIWDSSPEERRIISQLSDAFSRKDRAEELGILQA
jgi:hypothetical protein